MNDELKKNIDEMLSLYLEIDKEFKWENHLSKHFAALTYTLKNLTFKKESIEEIKKFIKDHTGIFSCYRGNSLFLIAMLLCSRYENPKDEFSKMLVYDKKLREAGFKNSTYLPVANYALLLTCEDHCIDSRIKKAYEIYCEMKKNHPWITSGDDYPLCILLAESDDSVHASIENIEDCYTSLIQVGFSKGNGLQFLSHILSFSHEDSKVKAQRCMNIFERLKENKLKIYSNYYAALGFTTLLGNESKKAVDDLIDMAHYLNNLKKYKWLGKGMNVLIASAMISNRYIDEKKNKGDLVETALGISIEALIAAQSAATVAAISASTAAAASS